LNISVVLEQFVVAGYHEPLYRKDEIMIKPTPKKFISPESQFVNGCETAGFSVGSFWQWAYSDLQQNNIRGILAEFIVAKALNIPLSVRDTWDDYDLITPDGIKIEIKSGAYLQSWEQNELSKIVFTGLCGQAWDAENGRRGGEAQFRADIYIFAVQTAKCQLLACPLVPHFLISSSPTSDSGYMRTTR